MIALFAYHETAVLGATIFTIMVVAYAAIWAILAALAKQSRAQEFREDLEAWETRHGTLLRPKEFAGGEPRARRLPTSLCDDRPAIHQSGTQPRRRDGAE